jgi:hypothetical protein
MLRLALLLSILLSAALTPSAHAQQRPSAGFKAGTSVFSIAGSERTSFSPRAGLAASVWLLYPLAGPIGVQAEASFVTKAVTGSTPRDPLLGGGSGEIERRFTFTYFEFPLLLAFEPRTSGRVRWRLTAGPHVAINQDAVVRARLPGGGLGNAETVEDLSGTTTGLTAGIMSTWEAGALGDVAVGLQASADLSNLREAEPEWNARGVFLYVGFAF